MRAADRRGFTLIELVISLVLLTLVANTLLAVLLTMQRVTRRQSEVAAMQGSLRSGAQLVQAELLELATNPGSGSSDLTALSTHALGYRAMRGIGESCEVTTSAVKIRKSSYAGLRAPTAGRDGLWLYLEGDSTQTADDSWLSLSISAVTASSCPDGADAWAAAVELSPTEVSRAWSPGPVRTYEEMEMGRVSDGGEDWLGIRSASFGENTLVPVAGPLTSNGVGFAYFDLAGDSTSSAPDVATIVVTLRGTTERAVSGGSDGSPARPTDSLSFRVRLRNAP